MKKYEIFVDCLKVLEKADFNNSYNDRIYRMGILTQFNRAFDAYKEK